MCQLARSGWLEGTGWHLASKERMASADVSDLLGVGTRARERDRELLLPGMAPCLLKRGGGQWAPWHSCHMAISSEGVLSRGKCKSERGRFQKSKALVCGVALRLGWEAVFVVQRAPGRCAPAPAAAAALLALKPLMVPARQNCRCQALHRKELSAQKAEECGRAGPGWELQINLLLC